ncbi:hypothetical protein QZH41_002392 [Actinostola sp. cb2023]|nr:hypothetical protein QZH41_002392 [Actinostola sp. cb2023]
MRAWRGYNIGPGKYFTDAQLARFGTPQGPTNMIIEHTFTTPSFESGLYSLPGASAPPRPISDHQIYHLSQNLTSPTRKGWCTLHALKKIAVYQFFFSLQRHLDVGKHLLKLECESPYDKIKLKWAEACKSVAAEYTVSKTSLPLHQAPHGTGRLGTPKVEQIYPQNFLQGEETCNKANASDVSSKMKSVRDGNGQKLFPKAEWLTMDKNSLLLQQALSPHKKRLSIVGENNDSTACQ